MFGIGGDRQIISLDWDRKSLRMIQWQISKDRAKAIKSLAAPIASDVNVKDAESMGTFIRQVLMREQIKTQAVIVDIPRDQAVLNTISLPAVDMDDLAGMVPLQVAKELPFPLHDAVVDFAVREEGPSSSTVDVLVAAIRREVLSFYKSVCRVAGLKLERMGLRPYANMVAINDMLGADIRGRVLFADVGPTLTEIDILRDGALVFSRAASVHLEGDYEEDTEESSAPKLSTTDDPQHKIIDNLVVEITRSAEAYRTTDPGARFDRLVVGGSSGLESQLAEAMSKRFLVPAKIYDPARVFTLATTRGESTAGFAAAIGLGLGHAAQDKLHFDFLHPKRPLDAAARRKQKLPLIAAVVGGVLLIGVVAYGIGIYPKQNKIERLKVEIAELEKKNDRYDPISKLVRQAKHWQEQQLIWPDELRLFVEALPDKKQGYLKSLKLDTGKGLITFEIAARDQAVLADLEKKLNESKHPNEKEAALKATSGQKKNDPRNKEYPIGTTMSVRSTRIMKLLEQADKKKKNR